jgi:hypothetical protein
MGDREDRKNIPWSEILLTLMSLAMVVQLVPSLWSKLLCAGDISSWSRHTWLWCFGLICVVCAIGRFCPDLWQAWRDRSATRAQSRAHMDHAKQLKEARERRERMEESRRRRIY